MSNEIAIKVENVSKTFRLPHEKSGSIKSIVVNFWRRDKSYEKQKALEGITFEVKKGEFFGIVGRNGSGKSTLLKLLAGIYTPDTGNIHVDGKLTPFIELGVGFSPELSGRENVYLNGALLGFDHKEMKAMYEEIVRFAELERFMDQKLKNYSSGMQVRLAFSIAIRANTPILLLDEVLAVGDASFKAKCDEYFDKVKKDSGQTVVLVTHDMAAVQKYCNRAILINDGKIELNGEPGEISNQYTLENFEEKPQEDSNNKNLSNYIKRLEITRRSPLIMSDKDNLGLSIVYELNESIDVYLGIAVKYNGISILEHNSLSINIGSEKSKKYRVNYELPLESFNTSDLVVDVAIFNKANKQLLGYKTSSTLFKVKTKTKYTGGVMLSKGSWTIE